MSVAKPFDIPKRVVWDAYKKVRANRGAAGVDQQSMVDFERDLAGNLYKLWNRLSSGSYHPPPVRQVGIPKKSGGTRYLGVPTVADRIAQTVVKRLLEPQWDAHFDSDSYGYRPGRSAKDAVAVTRKRCWRYDWVVEFDIQGAFDNIDHGLMMKAVRKHVPEAWMVLYIERWLTAPVMTPDGVCEPRDRGTPQGGVISPLLMNLFMHYAFDYWMRRTFPGNPFARYADDAVIHCQTRSQAEKLLSVLARRLADCKLRIHPEKSKIVYCKDSRRRGRYPTCQFTFLGFTFRPRCAQGPDGKLFTSFLPAVSDEAVKHMRAVIRGWRIHRRTNWSLEALAQLANRVLQGWWNYYGRFYPSAMRVVFDYLNRRLMLWGRRKYRRMRGRLLASYAWLRRIATAQPGLFVCWRWAGIPTAR